VSNTSLVVIGASAGGVESLRRLVGRLPGDLPAAVAVVLHLSPTSKSMLAAILTRSGPLVAHQAVDGEVVEDGQIVVAPPDHHLLVEDHVFRVARGPTEKSARPAVDPLFRTAARCFGCRVIGVVLSGSLDDGTAGLFEIKRRGGWTMVQDPREALHPDMPQSAIEHVVIDVIADSAALADHIADAIHHGTPSRAAPSASAGDLEIEAPSTGKSFVERQERPMDEALWASLRIVAERVQLTRRMLDRASRRGQPHIGRLLEARLRELAVEEHLLQRALENPAGTVAPTSISRRTRSGGDRDEVTRGVSR
jgi:two-component system chemotaxis response regulator CheB